MPDLANQSVLSSLRLSKALSLARQGRVRDAEALLAPGDAAPDDTLSLQAVAALATSTGDYGRALHFWRTLLQRNPTHGEARRMIAAIELWLSRPAWLRYLPVGGAVVAAALFLAGIMWAFGDSPTPAAATRAVSAPATSASPIMSPANVAPARSTPPPMVTFPPPPQSAPKRRR